MQKPPILTRRNPHNFNFSESISMRNPEFGDSAGVGGVADPGSESGEAPPCRRSRRLAAEQRREFPPPISWLARAEDPPSLVPWVWRRYHTSDGRLVIREERAERREFLLTDRSDGRLVLNLIHVDGAAEEGDAAVEEVAAPECCKCVAAEEGESELGGGGEGRGDPKVEEVAPECYKYTGAGVKPCGGFVATAPVFMPPVTT